MVSPMKPGQANQRMTTRDADRNMPMTPGCPRNRNPRDSISGRNTRNTRNPAASTATDGGNANREPRARTQQPESKKTWKERNPEATLFMGVFAGAVFGVPLVAIFLSSFLFVVILNIRFAWNLVAAGVVAAWKWGFEFR
ncbi:hypothetical protein QBC37DRAFT_367377 [Rhypophila decipiens]|uniref:Uncharacterized protein n=1 Tax=Rhypophila decipiens TaxID=261697 RepID=A0AAN6YM69_9PEZI|nr:hypothetical protein QBC37DRAFT_367377 [Rhypophila decipiens]